LVKRVAHLPVLEDHDERERVRTTTTHSTGVLRDCGTSAAQIGAGRRVRGITGSDPPRPSPYPEAMNL
jgi:hypothetical protein